MWPWLFTAAGRRVIFAAAALAALGAGFLALRAHYIAIGKGEAAAAALDAGAKQLAAQEKQFESRYAALDAQRAADATRSEALLGTAAKLSAELAGLASERARERAQVAALPESSLIPDLRHKLNLEPESNAATLSLPELRATDAIVTDYPLVTSENRDLISTNQTLTARTTSLSGEVTAVTAERDLAFDWGDSVFTQYRTCYNSFPRHRGFIARLCHVATFGLGCKPKQLSLPTPSSLAQQRPAKYSPPTTVK
jgi:F0F1-type ATP synthase membrane subunit c/vacuolar-type H+-ATPase subunit K